MGGITNLHITDKPVKLLPANAFNRTYCGVTPIIWRLQKYCTGKGLAFVITTGTRGFDIYNRGRMSNVEKATTGLEPIPNQSSTAGLGGSSTALVDTAMRSRTHVDAAFRVIVIDQ